MTDGFPMDPATAMLVTERARRWTALKRDEVMPSKHHTTDVRVAVSPRVLQDLLWYTFRYALGRRTITVGHIVDILISWQDRLSVSHRDMMLAEIADAIQRNEAGMDMDVREWERLRAALVELGTQP